MKPTPILQTLFLAAGVAVAVMASGASPNAVAKEVKPNPYSDNIHNIAAVGVAARHLGLDPALLMAMAIAESRGEATAQSHRGARGTMQVMPSTAKGDIGVLDPDLLHDPYVAATAGTIYFRKLLDMFDGDELKAVAAYNAGPGRVRKWGLDTRKRDWYWQIRFSETRFYVWRVMRYRTAIRGCNPETQTEKCLELIGRGN